jgi:predicted secreted protein
LPFSTPLAVAIYLTIWWIVLFAILPFGVRSSEEESDTPIGGDPGAPVAPKLWIKAVATTVVATILFALFVLYVNWVG